MIVYRDGDPSFCWTVHPTEDTDVKEYFVRFRVQNIGRSLARKCEVRVVRVFQNDSKTEKMRIPINLKWSGYHSYTVDIRGRGAFEYLDFVSASEGVSEINLVSIERESTGLSPHEYTQFPFKKEGQYVVHLILYSDDTNPIEKRFLIETESDVKVFPGLKVSEISKSQFN